MLLYFILRRSNLICWCVLFVVFTMKEKINMVRVRLLYIKKESLRDLTRTIQIKMRCFAQTTEQDVRTMQALTITRPTAIWIEPMQISTPTWKCTRNNLFFFLYDTKRNQKVTTSTTWMYNGSSAEKMFWEFPLKKWQWIFFWLNFFGLNSNENSSKKMIAC